jgi:hypothetical protein
MTTTRANKYFTDVLAAALTGFTSKSGMQDALDTLNRAYDEGCKDAIQSKLLDTRAEGCQLTGTNLDLYYGLPALHVWKPKHAALYANFAAEVKFANECAELRANIKGTPLVAKAPTKASTLKAARAAVAKTCQICGRPILAETGVIAHHGYQRPGMGWQTSSCFGARHLPFEVSRDALGEYITIIQQQLSSLFATHTSVTNDEANIRVTYRDKQFDKKSFWASISNYAAQAAEHAANARFGRLDYSTYAEAKAAHLDGITRRIKDTAQHLKDQQARFDAWRAA